MGHSRGGRALPRARAGGRRPRPRKPGGPRDRADEGAGHRGGARVAGSRRRVGPGGGVTAERRGEGRAARGVVRPGARPRRHLHRGRDPDRARRGRPDARRSDLRRGAGRDHERPRPGGGRPAGAGGDGRGGHRPHRLRRVVQARARPPVKRADRADAPGLPPGLHDAAARGALPRPGHRGLGDRAGRGGRARRLAVDAARAHDGDAATGRGPGARVRPRPPPGGCREYAHPHLHAAEHRARPAHRGRDDPGVLGARGGQARRRRARDPGDLPADRRHRGAAGLG